TSIYDLAFVGDTLYAAGQFTNVDGVAANGLAKWDGTNWSSVGFSGIANCLAVDGGNLYVGGTFATNLSGLGLTNIARWDGNNWSALSGGLAGPPYIVYAIAATNGLVYAGGIFVASSGSSLITNVAVWNGSSWSGLGANPNVAIYSLALNGPTLYASGS